MIAKSGVLEEGGWVVCQQKATGWLLGEGTQVIYQKSRRHTRASVGRQQKGRLDLVRPVRWIRQWEPFPYRKWARQTAVVGGQWSGGRVVSESGRRGMKGGCWMF